MTYAEFSYYCDNCVKDSTKICSICGELFVPKEDGQAICNFCKSIPKAVKNYKKILENIDIESQSYVSMPYFSFKDCSTVELFSRLNYSSDDDPFDILFISNYDSTSLVIVHHSSELYNYDAMKNFDDSLTATQFKRFSNYYKIIKKERKIMATLLWDETEAIDIWYRPINLRAQTYDDMDYRKEWAGPGEYVEVGNNYGDTDDFYIIGRTRKI